MSGCSPLGSEPAPHACAFYRRALLTLQAAQVPFLVGGGYALAHYVGIIRHTVTTQAPEIVAKHGPFRL
jgi:hypothetical protein